MALCSLEGGAQIFLVIEGRKTTLGLHQTLNPWCGWLCGDLCCWTGFCVVCAFLISCCAALLTVCFLSMCHLEWATVHCQELSRHIRSEEYITGIKAILSCWFQSRNKFSCAGSCLVPCSDVLQAGLGNHADFFWLAALKSRYNNSELFHVWRRECPPLPVGVPGTRPLHCAFFLSTKY